MSKVVKPVAKVIDDEISLHRKVIPSCSLTTLLRTEPVSHRLYKFEDTKQDDIVVPYKMTSKETANNDYEKCCDPSQYVSKTNKIAQPHSVRFKDVEESNLTNSTQRFTKSLHSHIPINRLIAWDIPFLWRHAEYESQVFSYLDHIWTLSFCKNDLGGYGFIITLYPPMKDFNYLNCSYEHLKLQQFLVSCKFMIIDNMNQRQSYVKAKVFVFTYNMTSRGFYNFITKQSLKRYLITKPYIKKRNNVYTRERVFYNEKELRLRVEMELVSSNYQDILLNQSPKTL